MPLLLAYFVIWPLKKLNVLKESRQCKVARGWAIALLIPLTLAACLKGYYNSTHPVVTHYEVNLPYEGAPQESNHSPDYRYPHWRIGEKRLGGEDGRNGAKREARRAWEVTRIDYYFDYIEDNPQQPSCSLMHPDKNRIFHVLAITSIISTWRKNDWLSLCGTLLRDSVVQLNDSLYLIGRDDAYNTARAPLSN